MDWESDSEDDEFETGLTITREAAEVNYQIAGTLVDEPPDEISIANHEHLLSDAVHTH